VGKVLCGVVISWSAIFVVVETLVSSVHAHFDSRRAQIKY
jgi:hypothetical protein